MKTATKKAKKTIEYDETNVPEGYCMSGNFMNDEDAKKMAKFIDAQKAKQPKNILQKIFS